MGKEDESGEPTDQEVQDTSRGLLDHCCVRNAQLGLVNGSLRTVLKLTTLLSWLRSPHKFRLRAVAAVSG
jgi:hypothetical protein